MTNVFEIPIVANFTYEIHYLAFHMLTLVNESKYNLVTYANFSTPNKPSYIVD